MQSHWWPWQKICEISRSCKSRKQKGEFRTQKGVAVNQSVFLKDFFLYIFNLGSNFILQSISIVE